MPCKALFVSPCDLNPKPGDLIEINREFYSHWVIYVGDGYVVHVTNDDDHKKEVSISGKAIVRLSKLSKVANRYLVRVNNLEESARRRNLKSRTPHEAVATARADVDKDVVYGLFGKNCEFYVTLWKYGEGWSDQLDSTYWKECAQTVMESDAGKVAVTVGAGVAVTGLLIGLGSLFFSGKNNSKRSSSE